MERLFKAGDQVKHFKYERLSEYEKKETKMCLYEIICEANHTENGKSLVIYKSLNTGEIYARPRGSFYSEVDKKKYPDIDQKYRFEKLD